MSGIYSLGRTIEAEMGETAVALCLRRNRVFQPIPPSG